jgi:hypothetical protein
MTGSTINNTTIGATTPSTGVFTTVDIATSGTDAQVAPNTGITGWNYSGISKSIGTEEGTPTGLFISPDGLNMYVNGSAGDDVNQYTLSTAFNVSTATYVRTFSTAAQDSAPQDVFFKPDGLTMFILGGTNDVVFQYTLSSAWDISTASYASKSFSVAAQDTTSTGLWFKTDGTTMYMVGTGTDTVYQYTLGTAWDVSTASYASISFDISAQEGTPNQVNLSADGLTMWVLGAAGDDINEYTLGTAWNVSTATFVNNFYIGFQETASTGMFIDSTAANRVYMVGTTNDTVYQYNTATNSISAVTDVFNTTSNARVQGNLAVQSNAYVDGTFAVQGTTVLGTTTISGTLTAQTAVNFSTTASNISIGTGQTGATTLGLGGTGQTGTLTVGQSTVSQTTNIQAGATASGSTKAINIGTAGLSGSTTTIAIGSAVSGATSTTTLNGSVNIANGSITGGTVSGTRVNPRAVAAGATSGTITPNGDTTDVFNAFGLTGAITVDTPSGTPVDGQRLMLRFEDNGTGRGITWTGTSGAYRAVGVTLPTTTVASKVTYVGCVYNSNDTFWDAIAVATQA